MVNAEPHRHLCIQLQAANMIRPVGSSIV